MKPHWSFCIGLLAVAGMLRARETHPEPGGWSQPAPSGAKQPPPSPPAKPVPQPKPDDLYRTADGAFSFRLPVGWKATRTSLGGVPVEVLAPATGDARILVNVSRASASTIQELAQQAAMLALGQLLPGFRLAQPAAFSQVGGAPAAELSYAGDAGGVPFIWWHAVSLTDGQAVAVLGGSRAEESQALRRHCQFVLNSLRISAPPPGAKASPASGALAQQIVGHWTWYHRTAGAGGGTIGGTSKEIWFYPNGRFQYSASTYTPNLPSGVDPTTTITGAYQVQGNTVVAQADNGQRITYTAELVEGGKGLRINGDLFIRE